MDPYRKHEQKKTEAYIQTVRNAARDLKSLNYVKGTAQFTDMTNTEYFLKLYDNQVKFCCQWNKFLVWDGKKWAVDNKGVIDDLIYEMVRDMYLSATVIKDPQLRIDFEGHCKKSESMRRRKSLLESISKHKSVKVEPDELDTKPYIFNCQNGRLNLETGEFKEHEKEDLSTKCSAFIYDPDACCPNWERFLLQIMNQDIELITFIQMAMGYTMTNLTTEQCMFILWGAGANGKSTFLNTLANLFGDYAEHADAETFMKKQNAGINNDIARLKAARFVTTSETEQGKRLSESLVKQITGDDMLTARFLYGEFFSFKPTFKIFMATNHKPSIKGSDFGIWRRLRLIPFTVTVPENLRDKNLQEKLEAENSGILNWLVKGFRMWQQNGLITPECVKTATEEYQSEMDTVGQFLKDCCQIDATETLKVTNKILYEAYVKWCNASNEKVNSQRYLALRLQEKGFRKTVGNNDRYWIGLNVLNAKD